MPPESPKSDQLWLMLGEIRGDLKYLVEERRSTNRRLDEVETEVADKLQQHDERLRKLEAFKVRIGVVTGALGVLVPTAITVIANKLGLLQ